MTKAVSNKEICYNKEVFLMCEHGHFSLKFAAHEVSPPPKKNILLGFANHICNLQQLYIKLGKTFWTHSRMNFEDP